MSKHPAINSLYSYGIEGEEKLLSTISFYVGEPVKKTSATFDHLDAIGTNSFSEIKRRGSDWSYHDKIIKQEGWILPSCKVIRAWEELSKGKKVYFFYFWMVDKSLWVYEMKPNDFTDAKSHFIPNGHWDNMLHVRIMEDKWKRVNCDLRNVVFEEDQCWIE